MTTVRLKCGANWLEVSASTVCDAVKEAAAYIEVFGEPCCGKCGSTEIRPNHRVVDDNDYYSLSCNKCRAQLDFGKHKVGGTLFAKRKHPNGDWDNEHGGWYHYRDRANQTQSTGNTSGSDPF